MSASASKTPSLTAAIRDHRVFGRLPASAQVSLAKALMVQGYEAGVRLADGESFTAHLPWSCRMPMTNRCSACRRVSSLVWTRELT